MLWLTCYLYIRGCFWVRVVGKPEENQTADPEHFMEFWIIGIRLTFLWVSTFFPPALLLFPTKIEVSKDLQLSGLSITSARVIVETQDICCLALLWGVTGCQSDQCVQILVCVSSTCFMNQTSSKNLTRFHLLEMNLIRVAGTDQCHLWFPRLPLPWCLQGLSSSRWRHCTDRSD